MNIIITALITAVIVATLSYSGTIQDIVKDSGFAAKGKLYQCKEVPK